MEPIVLDGRTGEGGGQLVRMACGLAALTCQPIVIDHVRGNREGSREGGLKAQHVTALSWLARVSDAQVEGLAVGSQRLSFHPRRPPSDLKERHFEIKADTDAASTLLILQAILPFVLFAGGGPITLELFGGTNVHWSLGYEYFDQVLMPVLTERFGFDIDRKLVSRGWNLGPRSQGQISLKIQPIPLGHTLKFSSPPRYTFPASYHVGRVDVNLIVPGLFHQLVQDHVVKALVDLYPDADVHFKVVQDSGGDARWSILLVAHSDHGLCWARDALFSLPKKAKTSPAKFVQQTCVRLCRDLHQETSLCNTTDEFLQDQLVFAQVLAEGYSSFPRGGNSAASTNDALEDKLGKLGIADEASMTRDETHQPFGHGSTHTTTARWVASKLLPGTKFYNQGDIVKGVGFSVQRAAT